MIAHLLTGMLAACLALGAHAGARPPSADKGSIDPAILKIDETRHLGQPMGGATAFLDERGRPFAMSDLLGKPVILVLSYFGCDGTCPTINQNLAAALTRVARFQAGRDFHVLTVSFDKQDTPESAAEFVGKMRALQPEVKDGWRFAVLQGAAEDRHEKFAGSVGFQFFWSRIDKTFLHPNVLVFLTPEGRVARYLYGTAMDPRNLELALIDADWGRISNTASAVFDMITGACFSYNYSEGRYQPNYALFAGVGSLLLGLSLVGMGFFGYRRKAGRRPGHAT